MKLAAVAENAVERALLALGLVPTPLVDTFVALALARAVLTATRAGLFDALADGPLPADEVARRCRTDPRATEALLFALAGARYVRFRAGRYALAPVARRWLLSDRPGSFRDAVLHRYLDAAFLEHADEFLRTGRPVDFHEPGRMTPDQWELYQRGQRAGAVHAAPEVARRTPVPRRPRTMLDIGGGHGHFSAALCRRHPVLRATILDLPEAVAQARPLLAAEGLGDRITLREGDALMADLGEGAYDLVFVANLVHHFSEEQNRNLTRRIARALRPGGFCVIGEIVRESSPERAGQIGGLAGFFFSITSASGAWSFDEMAAWQRAAGLLPQRPIRLRLSPGYGLQAARKGAA